MNNNRIALIALFCLGGLGFYYFFNAQIASEVREDQLVIGTVSGYAPFVSINSQGEYEGFDVDVAQELARRMQKKLVLKDCGSMVPLMLSLQNGAADLLLWALDITQARLREMTMIQYQGEDVTSYPLLFWQRIPEGVRSLDDLKGKGAVVAVEPGSTQEKFLDQFDFITKKTLEKVVDRVMDIKYGKSLAAFTDPALVPTLKQKNPEIQVLDIPLGQEWMTYGIGVCVKKENKALADQVQTIVDAMKRDGTIKNLEIKWQLKEGNQ